MGTPFDDFDSFDDFSDENNASSPSEFDSFSFDDNSAFEENTFETDGFDDGDFGSQSNFTNNINMQNQFDNMSDDTDLFEESNENDLHKKLHLNENISVMKVTFVASGILLLLFFIVIGLSKIKITKKPTVKNNNTVVTQQEQGNSTQINKSNSTVVHKTDSKYTQVSLTELDELVDIDYSGDVFATKGTVYDKVKYLDDSQVVYCLIVDISVGNTNQYVKYYCSYDTFKSCNLGETVTVQYQQVSKNCFSVNNITK